MTFDVAHSEKECCEKIKDGMDIIILANRLFGFYIFTEKDEARTAIYYSYKWSRATLADISWFFIPIVNIKELIQIIEDL